MQNFTVTQTVRLYNPSLIAELARQHEDEAHIYRNRNEFMTRIIELGLEANAKNKARAPKEPFSKEKTAKEPPADETDELTDLLLKIHDNLSERLTIMLAKLALQQKLLCALYNIALALNNGETLFSEKIESGFYDDAPHRFEEILADIMEMLGLTDRK